MQDTLTAIRAGSLRFARFLVLVGMVALTGCATHYVDGNTKEIAAASYRKPADPKPVQLLFEFQTKGALNARVTDLMKTQVLDQVKSSGMFSRVDDKPVDGGGLMSITLNNVPLSDDAFAKGFATGLTLGLAGNQVTDGYICTIKYTSDQQKEPLVKLARHAIHTTVGAKGAPPNSIKSDSIQDAVKLMSRQVVSTALNDLSQDAAFK